MSSTPAFPIGHRGRIAVGTFLVLSLLYSVLILGQPLAWVVFVCYLAAGTVTLWLLWRFVVAVERIAAAAETVASDVDAVADDTDPAPSKPADRDRPPE